MQYRGGGGDTDLICFTAQLSLWISEDPYPLGCHPNQPVDTSLVNKALRYSSTLGRISQQTELTFKYNSAVSVDVFKRGFMCTGKWERRLAFKVERLLHPIRKSGLALNTIGMPGSIVSVIISHSVSSGRVS